MHCSTLYGSKKLRSDLQSLPLESAFYTVIWAILTHKNGSPKSKISILCFKDALTPT